MIADCLVKQGLNVVNTFGSEDMIHVLPNFEGEENVEVMTADDFLRGFPIAAGTEAR